jgi:Domain of unknown function (DUF1707)
VEDAPDRPPDGVAPEPADEAVAGGEAAVGSGPRASDSDRERFATLLERHFVEGRLSEEEFSDRIDRALQARTLIELYALSADLPDPPAVDVPPPQRGQKRHVWRFWRA